MSGSYYLLMPSRHANCFPYGEMEHPSVFPPTPKSAQRAAEPPPQAPPVQTPAILEGSFWDIRGLQDRNGDGPSTLRVISHLAVLQY